MSDQVSTDEPIDLESHNLACMSPAMRAAHLVSHPPTGISPEAARWLRLLIDAAVDANLIARAITASTDHG